MSHMNDVIELKSKLKYITICHSVTNVQCERT